MINGNNIKDLLLQKDADGFISISREIPNDFWSLNENLILLIESANIEHLGLRDYIYRILLNLNEEDKYLAASHLTTFLYNKNFELRNLAADILTKLGVASNNALIPLLKDPDVDVKKFASDILGYTGTDSEIPEIVNLLNDEDLNVFTSAIESIGRIFERHSEKIGLADSMLELLFSIFNVNNYDTKPVIIEAIAKIGGEKAENFLIKLLDSEDDIFIKTTVIDSLAICGNSTSICMILRDELPNYSEILQPVILKTLVAIAFRIGCEIDFDENYRSIAILALQDDDSDIRTAGLLALGSNYLQSDIEYLAKEYLSSSDELKYYILNNLLNNNINLLDVFLKEFMELIDFGDHAFDLVEMLNLSQDIFSELDFDTQKVLIKTIIYNTQSKLESGQYEIFEILYSLSPEIFYLVKEELENDDNFGLTNELNDLQIYLNNN